METVFPTARILVVDDEEVNLLLLERALERGGYRDLTLLNDPREVLERLDREPFDLLISDLHMPFMNGYELIGRVSAQQPPDAYFPIAVITADASSETEHAVLARGAHDFISKPFRPLQVRLRVNNLLRTRLLHLELQRHNVALEERVLERTIELEAARLDLLERLAMAAEFRDQQTGRHTQRVGLLASLIAERAGLERDEVDLIRRAAPLHDVGKIGIPDHILLKPGRLSDGEYQTMKQHVRVGAELLSRSQSRLINMAEEIALSHHERWDGSGYPHGLAGDDIPLVGQIVAVADVFDTLINDRPYKPAWPLQKAIDEMVRQRGRWFAPHLIDILLEVLDERPELLGELSTVTASP